MSAEDRFERNVADLVKRGALPLDGPRSARAKEAFLRATSPERTSWKLAAAAAALLVAVTVVWSARTERPAESKAAPGQTAPAPVSVIPGEGGNVLLKGVLKLRGARLRFEARSPLMEGVVFRVRGSVLEEQIVDGRLATAVRESSGGAVILEQGVFDYDWPYRGPGGFRIEVSAPDDFQSVTTVKRLGVPESERKWTFEYAAWDGRIYGKLGPQLEELAGLARDARELVARVEAAVASEALFKEHQKALIADAERQAARAGSFAGAGLYPAAAREVAQLLRNLAQSLGIFTWEGGAFAGPKSYYTNGKKGTTHRGEPFDVAALRRYLDESILIAGRELVLWSVKDIRRNSFGPEGMALLKEQATHPGVADFAPRLMDGKGVKLDELEAEVRQLPK